MTTNTSYSADLMVVGPLCIDINVDRHGDATRTVGGAAVCSAAAAASLGHRVSAVVSLAEADDGLLSSFPLSVRHIIPVPSSATTSIQNVYSTDDQERRVSTALAHGDAIRRNDIPLRESPIVQLAGLMVGDYERDLVLSLSAHASVAVDMQAFLRAPDPRTGELRLQKPDADQGFFSHITYLKVDTAEGEFLTGLTDRREIASRLQTWGAEEVMVSNAEEILIASRAGIHSCPLRPANLSGRTGRGDTVFSAYISERLTKSIEESLLMACATVSLKMESPGPLDTCRSSVEAYRNQRYADLLSDATEVRGDVD